MGYYPQFTSPIESDIFGSNDSLIVRHFVDSLFYGHCWTSVLIRGGERAAVARWSAKQSCLDGAPHPVGHCPAAAQLTLALSLLLPLPSFLPIHSSPRHNPPPPPPKTGTRYHRRAHKGGVFGVSVSRPGAVPALASGRARQGLVPRKAAGASCRAPPPGGIGSAEPKHSPS